MVGTVISTIKGNHNGDRECNYSNFRGCSVNANATLVCQPWRRKYTYNSSNPKTGPQLVNYNIDPSTCLFDKHMD